MKATFANYSSYSCGLNGIMVDLQGLAGVPGVADFSFRVGNSDLVGAWAAAPAPVSIALRSGAGASRWSDRVTLIWEPRAIEKQWLQVAVLATAATGLPAPHAFYFGQATGETGNQAGAPAPDARVDVTTRSWPGPTNPASATRA